MSRGVSGSSKNSRKKGIFHNPALYMRNVNRVSNSLKLSMIFLRSCAFSFSWYGLSWAIVVSEHKSVPRPRGNHLRFVCLFVFVLFCFVFLGLFSMQNLCKRVIVLEIVRT